MKKRLLSLALAIVMCLSLLPAAAFAAEEESPLHFQILDRGHEKTAILVECVEEVTGDLVIPDTYEGCPVTKISRYVFMGMTGLTSVYIPDTVRSIGCNTFDGCTSLAKIHLPADLEKLEDDVFRGTPWYEDRPDGIVYEQGFAIRVKGSPSLGNVVIPDGITAVLPHAFEDQQSLTSVTFPDTTRLVMESAFYGCKNLTTVNFGRGMQDLRDHAFDYCLALTSADFPDGLKSIGTSAFGNCRKLASIHLPSSLEYIGHYALTHTAWFEAQNDGPLYLDNVLVDHKGTYPQNFDLRVRPGTRILADQLYRNEDTLVKVTLPGSMQNVGTHTFEGCDQLQTVVLENGFNALSDDMFYECPALTSVSLPESVDHLGRNTFDSCTALSTVRLPQGLTDLGDAAFHNCTSLRSINLPQGLTEIPSATFKSCSNLDRAAIPARVKRIGNEAFRGCERLAEITLGEQLESIGQSAFSECYKLQSVTFTGNAPSIAPYAFFDINCTFYYPGDDPTWGSGLYAYATNRGNRWVKHMPEGILSAPANFHAEETGKGVELHWDSVPGAARYGLWRCDVEDHKFVHLTTTTSTHFTDTDQLADSRYYLYHVQAIAGDGTPGEVSNDLRFDKPIVIPDPTVTHDENGKPVISGSFIPGMVNYWVYCRINPSDSPNFVGHVSHTDDGWYVVHQDAKVGTVYHYYYHTRTDFVEGDSEEVSIACVLPQPQITASKNAEGKPVITWAPVEGAQKYEVQYSTDGHSFQTLTSTTKTEVTHTGATGGDYTYRVRALWTNSVGNSDWSKTAAVSLPVTKLTAPTLTVTNNAATGKPYLDWTTVAGAQDYEVYYSTSKDGSYSRLYHNPNPGVKHGSAKTGTTYYYKVRAVAGSIKGDWSTIETRTCDLGRPDVKASLNADGKPVLTWKAVPGAKEYLVYYRTDGGSFERLTSVHGTTLKHGSAKPGHTYTYKVRALASRSAANSAWSYYDTLQVEGSVAPTLTATNKRTTGKPYLKWDKVDGAAKYEVYRSTSKNGEFTRLWSGSSTALTNGGAKAGSTYYYKVRAIAADGTKGPWSEIKTRTCDLPQPDVKVTTRSDGKPVLTWQKVSGAVKYEVYRRTDGGDFVRLSTVKGTKLTNTSAQRGHTYTYKVRAIASKSAANSSYSYYDTITVK